MRTSLKCSVHQPLYKTQHKANRYQMDMQSLALRRGEQVVNPVTIHKISMFPAGVCNKM